MADIGHEVFLVIHEVRMLLGQHVRRQRDVAVFILASDAGVCREVAVCVGNDGFMNAVQAFRVISGEKEEHKQKNQKPDRRNQIHPYDEPVRFLQDLVHGLRHHDITFNPDAFPYRLYGAEHFAVGKARNRDIFLIERIQKIGNRFIQVNRVPVETLSGCGNHIAVRADNPDIGTEHNAHGLHLKHECVQRKI